MAPIKSASTRTTPFLMRLLPLLGIAYLGGCFLADACLPPEKTDFVEWVELNQAVAKAKKLDKPILYDFSADWCGPCMLMRAEIFGDKKVAKEINQNFVPVQVIDRHREEQSNPLEVDRLQKKYDIEAFPTLVVTKVGRSSIDIQKGYPDKKTTEQFISNALLQSMSRGGDNELDWQSLDDVLGASHKSELPLLILFWDDTRSYSRYSYLANKNLVQTIKKNFIPIEVTMPVKAEEMKLAQSKALIEKLAVKRSPTLVIVPPNGGTPHFQIGYASFDDNNDFLQKYLRFRDK
jgi:thiol-disulfide isomerase/thioredoxin